MYTTPGGHKLHEILLLVVTEAFAQLKFAQVGPLGVEGRRPAPEIRSCFDADFNHRRARSDTTVASSQFGGFKH